MSRSTRDEQQHCEKQLAKARERSATRDDESSFERGQIEHEHRQAKAKHQIGHVDFHQKSHDGKPPVSTGM